MQEHKDFTWAAPDDLARMANEDTPWRYYEQTTVQFNAPGCPGQVVPAFGVGGGDEHPPLGSLHVVTAVQPNGEPGSADSMARLAVLDEELATMEIRSIGAVGSSLAGDYAEESRAVFGLSDDQARRLGLRFGQVAVFAWDGPRWSLLACATDRQTHRGWNWIAGVWSRSEV